MKPNLSSEIIRGNVPALLATVHAGALAIFLAWRFGGMEPTGRLVAACAAAIAPLITIAGWRAADPRLRRHFLMIAVPLAGLAGLVLIGCLNPYMTPLTDNGELVGLIPIDTYQPFFPSTALPAHSAQDFLFNAGLVLVGLNLFLTRPARGLQKLLLVTLALNAAVLACIGSAYKLVGATQIFGAFSSPNPNFFATFYYQNHWGAFALLGASAAGALALHFRDRAESSGGWEHSPGPAFAVLFLLLLVTLPLSGSRSATLAGALLALILIYRLFSGGRGGRTGIRKVLVPASILLLTVGAGTIWLIGERWQFLIKKTTVQWSEARAGGIGDARFAIYKATWQLYQERPLYGWGWRSFRYVFRRVQTLDLRMQTEQKEMTYVIDAHNDWLQFLAELGTVGAALGLAAVVGLARTASWKRWLYSPSLELAAGFACLGLMACVDFPFACPAVVVTAWCLLATAAAIAFDRERTRERAS